ncbi:MAG: hypothetical protein IKE60_26360 [Reyranella sp.]|uniref:phage terminase large subunit family protein n=1 Tax=Reyranella sp. TaxID=1929291 RepID=UPI0025CC4C35|nr:hypothetical protein [Reyranella sp.]MBR2818213.1 hypothetical protein [Reyranella sp.]
MRSFASGVKRISVRSGHNVGKTACVAWIVIWHAIVRFPQKTIVTSPSAGQLEIGLISELKKWMHALPEMIRNRFDIKADSIFLKAAPYDSQIRARTASKDSPEAMQGIHCEDGSVLLIVDEASGVPDPVFAAAEGSMGGPNASTILLSNPTRTRGYFFDTHHEMADTAKEPKATAWKTMHVNSANCGRDNRNFVQGIIDKYGIGSSEHQIRVLGEFPDTEANTLIPAEYIDYALTAPIEVDPKAPLIYGIDVGRFGQDRTVLVKRRGNVVIDIQWWARKDTAESAALINAQAEQDRPDEICIDTIGIGGGVADSLRTTFKRSNVYDVNVSEATSVNTSTYKLRDDLWWQLRDWLATKSVRLFPNDLLIEELKAPTYSYTLSSGKIVVLSKDLMKKTLGRSPDFADALCMTFAGQGALLSGRAPAWSAWGSGPLRRNLAGVV